MLHEGSIKHLRRSYSQWMKINGQPLMAGNFYNKNSLLLKFILLLQFKGEKARSFASAVYHIICPLARTRSSNQLYTSLMHYNVVGFFNAK
jgi:hypothetical protein